MAGEWKTIEQRELNERRKINASRKVSKSMNTSAWGVDHGVEISKGATRDFYRAEQPGWKGSKGDNKRRMKNQMRVRGAESAGALAGAGAGAALGAGIGAASRKRMGAQYGAILGGLAGGSVGGGIAGNRKFKEVYPGWKRADGGLTGRVKRV